MGTKIGFISFKVFDLPSPTELAVLKRSDRVIKPDGKTLSIGESHPAQPDFRAYAPELDDIGDKRFYKFAEELSPLMNAYHEHVQDVAVRQDILRRIQERYRQIQVGDEKHREHLDLFHVWMSELLFQRVYEHVGRLSAVYRKIRTHRLEESKIFAETHRQQRLEEAEVFPRLFEASLRNPYFQEIKVPNQLKALDYERIRLALNRRIKRESDEILLALRRDFAEGLVTKAQEKKLELLHLYKTKGRGNVREQRLRVLEDYETAWRYASEQFVNFRQIVREGVIEQAGEYPKLFRKAIGQIYESEIKVPNEHDHFEKMQQHVDEQRAVNERQNERKQVQSKTYMELRVGDALAHIDAFAARNVRFDARQSFNVQRAVNKSQASAQGMVFIAGREVPRVQVAVSTSIKSTRPLELGMHGSPRAPEVLVPIAPHNHAYFGPTAGVRSLDGKIFEQVPEAASMAAEHHRIGERVQFLLGAQSYAEQKLQQNFATQPTAAQQHQEQAERMRQPHAAEKSPTEAPIKLKVIK